MGFARLYFPTDGTAQMVSVLQDIAGVLTGNITQVANLRASSDTRTFSTIFNTANSNWRTAFPASIAWGSAASTSNVSIVLSSPCVNSTKTKFIRFAATSGTSSPGSGSINTTATATGYGAAPTYLQIVMQSCTGASSTTTLTNATSVNIPASSADQNQVSFGGTYITLHWSQRHCFLYGYRTTAAAGRRLVMANLEHTETTISQWANTAPVSHIALDTAATANSMAYTGTYTSGVQDLGSVSYLTELQHYNNQTQISTGVYNPLSDTLTFSLRNDFTLTSNASANYPTVGTKTSTGSTAIYLQPLFYHQHNLGIPHMYYSNLCNIYRVPPNLGSEGDLITIGSDTYVYLPFNNAWAFAVKRA